MKKILSTEQIRKTDAFTIEHEPIASIELMERASSAFVDEFIALFPNPISIYIFCGLGNNGGDGLAIARMLSERSYRVHVFIVRYSDQPSPDFLENEKRLRSLHAVLITDIKDNKVLDTISMESKGVLIDAMWGSGISRSIEGLGKQVIQWWNEQANKKVSVDIASGLAGDRFIESIRCTVDHTISFQLPKLSFFFSANEPYVGKWQTVTILLDDAFIENQESPFLQFTEADAIKLLQNRSRFSHKGTHGHALMISGSYGKMGACVLSTKAALRAGAGLVTAHIPKCGMTILQTAIPEAMAVPDANEFCITAIDDLKPYKAIGIGPGIGVDPETRQAVMDLLRKCMVPLVIDADALNCIAKAPENLENIPKNAILTPHPGEFRSLFGESENEYERNILQRKMAEKYQLYIVLKGAHTAIACPDGSCIFNNSGNPALATAGSGDILTGMITGLLAQGYAPKEAALLGVYVHGLAADLFEAKMNSQRMISREIIDAINVAFGHLYEQKR